MNVSSVDLPTQLAPLALSTLGLRLRVAVTFDGDWRGGGIDLPDIVGRQRDRGRGDVLVKSAELGRAGDRDNPWPLRQKPSQCDLRWRRLLL